MAVLERGDQRVSLLTLADDEKRIGAGDLDIERRAERSGRDDTPIAETRCGIHHDQRKILGEGRVLEAVVHDDDVRVRGLDGLGPGHPVGGHDGRRHACEQQRLIADLFCALALARPAPSPLAAPP